MIYIGADHGGFELKKHLGSYLKSVLRLDFEDVGAHEFNPEDDEPNFAIPLAQKVVKNKSNFGILICKTGLGACIAANKIKGGRAILGHNITAAEMGRKHNDANILCLSGDTLSHEHADAIVKKFLETKFDGAERFVRRIQQVAKIEK